MVHAQKLERWLGSDQIANLTESMRGWYGPPIAVGRLHGRIHVTKDGDFVGKLREPRRFSTLLDYSLEKTVETFKRAVRRNMGKASAGFSSLDDLISEATAGAKRREFMFNKTGPTGVVAV